MIRGCCSEVFEEEVLIDVCMSMGEREMTCNNWFFDCSVLLTLRMCNENDCRNVLTGRVKVRCWIRCRIPQHIESKMLDYFWRGNDVCFQLGWYFIWIGILSVDHGESRKVQVFLCFEQCSCANCCVDVLEDDLEFLFVLGSWVPDMEAFLIWGVIFVYICSRIFHCRFSLKCWVKVSSSSIGLWSGIDQSDAVHQWFDYAIIGD